MIELKKITNENFKECIKLSAGEGSDKFVAPNTISIAQAYVVQENDTCTPFPFAIYNDEEMVGFIQLAYYREDQEESIDEPIYEVWRFMIDEKFQGKGYGRAALLEGIKFAKTYPMGTANKLYLSYVPGNEKASSLYESVGFRANGEVEDGEIIMVYDMR